MSEQSSDLHARPAFSKTDSLEKILSVTGDAYIRQREAEDEAALERIKENLAKYRQEWVVIYGELFEVLPEALHPYLDLDTSHSVKFSSSSYNYYSAYLKLPSIRVRIQRERMDRPLEYHPQRAINIEDTTLDEPAFYVHYGDVGPNGYENWETALGEAASYQEDNKAMEERCAQKNAEALNPEPEPESEPKPETATDKVMKIIANWNVRSHIPQDQLISIAVVEQLQRIADSLASLDKYGINIYQHD